MSKEEVKNRIDELVDILQKHNYNYYVLSNPSISDYDFDILLKELEKLETDFPEFVRNDSPTLRVGGEPTKEFNTVTGEITDRKQIKMAVKNWRADHERV